MVACTSSGVIVSDELVGRNCVLHTVEFEVYTAEVALVVGNVSSIYCIPTLLDYSIYDSLVIIGKVCCATVVVACIVPNKVGATHEHDEYLVGLLYNDTIGTCRGVTALGYYLKGSVIAYCLQLATELCIPILIGSLGLHGGLAAHHADAEVELASLRGSNLGYDSLVGVAGNVLTGKLHALGILVRYGTGRSLQVEITVVVLYRSIFEITAEVINIY